MMFAICLLSEGTIRILNYHFGKWFDVYSVHHVLNNAHMPKIHYDFLHILQMNELSRSR